MGIRIMGTGSALPERVVTNKELEGLVSNYDLKSGDFGAWVRRVSGVETRHYAKESDTLDSLATAAAREALAMAGVDASSVGLIVLSTSMDTEVPNTAQKVARNLGIFKTPGYMMNAACAGFVYSLDDAAAHIARYKRVLVIGCEILSRYLNFEDPTTAILFGDGAGAVLVEEGSKSPYFFVPGADAGDEKDRKDRRVTRDMGKLIWMGGGNFVLRDASRAMAEVSMQVLEEAKKEGISGEDLVGIFPHQANRRITDMYAKQLPESLRPKVLSNIERVGNTSSAAIPILLDEEVRAGRVNRGDPILLTSVGGSYMFGASVLRF